MSTGWCDALPMIALPSIGMHSGAHIQTLCISAQHSLAIWQGCCSRLVQDMREGFSGVEAIMRPCRSAASWRPKLRAPYGVPTQSTTRDCQMHAALPCCRSNAAAAPCRSNAAPRCCTALHKWSRSHRMTNPAVMSHDERSCTCVCPQHCLCNSSKACSCAQHMMVVHMATAL